MFSKDTLANCTPVETGSERASSSARRSEMVLVAAIQIAIFLSALDQTIVNVAVPKLGTLLNAADRAAWIISSYLLFATIATPVAGRLSDIFGVKKVLTWACVSFAAASFLCGSAGLIEPFLGLAAMDQLLISRALQGAAGGAMIALCFIAVGDIFPVRERGKYQGFLAAAFVIAAIIGPSLGGWLIQSSSWRSIFYINIPPCIVAAALFMAVYPAATRAGSDRPSERKRSFISFAPVAIFRDQLVMVSLLTVFSTGIGLFGSTLLLATILENEVGMPPLTTGMSLTPLMLLVAGASVAGGYSISRTGRWKLLSCLALLCMLVGTLMLSTFSADSSLWQFFAAATIGGAGLGLLLPIHTIIIQNNVGRDVLGLATSMTQFFRSLGGTMGTGLMSAITIALLKKFSLQQSITVVILVYAVILAITLFLNLFLQEIPLKNSSSNE